MTLYEILLISFLLSAPEPIKCVRVIDGDTVELADGRKVRLLEIDAPESNQPYGPQSTKYLEGLIEGKMIVLVGSKKDRYRRTLSTIMLDELNVNHRMVELGHAWHYKRYSKSKELAALEQKARSKGLGLWSKPIAPWDWRRRKRK